MRRTVEFCDTYGHRQVGTPNLEASIDWVVDQLRADGFDNVHKEPATVRVWRRGEESATLTSPQIGDRPTYDIAMLGLGGSVGGDVTANVLVVNSFDELANAARLGAVSGRIVVFNQEWEGYAATGMYRGYGPSIATKLGAAAVLVKSLASFSLKSPHTGATQYLQTIPTDMGLNPILTGDVANAPIPAAVRWRTSATAYNQSLTAQANGSCCCCCRRSPQRTLPCLPACRLAVRP
eukprot:SAG31_NODE_177_length_21310_cov_8.894064_8_plen_236_part_00